MKSLSFYEQAGIVIPGAVLLFGIAVLLPGSRSLLAIDGVTIGGLGLFLILAYALGHAVAAVGNVIEHVFWATFGGMPSDWITYDPPKLLAAEQVEQLRVRVSERIGFECPAPRGLPRARWSPVFAQVYRDALVSAPGRIETFNGNYGLNRGLAASTLCLIPVALLAAPDQWRWPMVGGAALAVAVYLYRMYRFGVHFAREVYLGFLITDRPLARRNDTAQVAADQRDTSKSS